MHNTINSSEIGIVIWGCSGGYKVFCSNDTIRTYSNDGSVFKAEIAETLKDIRSFIRFHRICVDYYAVEFTSLYKVFTIYRSSDDNGSGAFVAITVYVPHSHKILNTRVVLNEMMDEFYGKYINPLSGVPLPVSFYDIEMFNRIIGLHKNEIVVDTSRFIKRRSTQDNTPRIWVYNDDAELDKFFDMPYYPRFYESQEIMFISRKIWDNKDDYKMTVLSQQKVLTDPGRPEGEGMIARFDVKDHKLKSFKINDIPMDVNSADGFIANRGDILEMTISHEYYQPWSSDKITLEEALRKKILYNERGNEKLYLWNSKGYTYLMKPAENFLPLNIDGEGINPEFISSQLALYDGRNTIKPVQRGDQWGFVIKGRQWEFSHSLHMCPCKEDFRMTLEVMSAILPTSYPNGINLALCQHDYKTAQGSARPANVDVTVSFGTKRCSYSLPIERLTFVAPVGAQIDINAKKYNCTVQENELTFVPIGAIAVEEPKPPQHVDEPKGGNIQPPTTPPKRTEETKRPLPTKKQQESKPEPVFFTVDVVNCKRFTRNDRVNEWKRVGSENGDILRTKVSTPLFNLYNSKDEAVCSVNLNASQMNAEENRKHGFTVNMPTTTYCRIEYKQSLLQRLGNKLVFSIGGLLAMALLVGGLYLLFFRQSPEKQKYHQIEAFYNKYYSQETNAVEDSIKLMHLIDSCAIYANNDNGERNGFNDDFNELAFNVVNALKNDPENRAASLYLLYMGEKDPNVTLYVNTSSLYHGPKPAFKNQKYVELVKEFLAVNPLQNNFENEVTNETQDELSSGVNEADLAKDNVAQTAAEGAKKRVGDDKKAAEQDANKKKEEVGNSVQQDATAKNAEKEFKEKLKKLKGNTIIEGEVKSARKAYDKLPPEMKKAKDDTRIKAYEALVPTRNASQIRSALDQYSNQYTQNQKAALEKISNQIGYDKYLKEAKAQNKPYIDIQLIKKVIKDE